MRAFNTYETDSDRRSAIIALTLLRIGVGAIFVAHGWQKLGDIQGTIAGFSQLGIPHANTMVYLAIVGELFGGLGLALGALTPLAALGPASVMVGAIYWVHRDNGLFVQHGGWEYPLTMILIALYFATHGAGPLSVDALVAKNRQRPARRRARLEATTHP